MELFDHGNLVLFIGTVLSWSTIESAYGKQWALLMGRHYLS